MAKLIDFGLAKVPVDELHVGAESHELTQHGVVMGTMAYLASEAALGMRAIERCSDLYALGLILYETLAGNPFEAASAAEMFAKHRKAMVPAIAERSPGVKVPAALKAIERKLLGKDPDERLQNARAVVAALDAVIREMEAGGGGGWGWLSGWRLVAVAVVLAGRVAAWLLAGR